jgi:AAA+ ATPase superfamily predicted ATPase
LSRFIGRIVELQELQRFLKKKTASLLVVRGRRRIGKSRLIEEFARSYRFLSFIGLPPTDKTTREEELAEFSRQFSERLSLPRVTFNDWGDAFSYLARETAKGRVVILLDEISWMGSKDPTFLGKLKTAWDIQFKKNDQLILLLCGSASTWIEKNILSSTGFLGRVSQTLTLEELPLQDCAKFWPQNEGHISAYEKA